MGEGQVLVKATWREPSEKRLRTEGAQYLGKGVGTSGPISQEIHRVLWGWKYIELFSEDLKFMANTETSNPQLHFHFSYINGT